MKRAMAVVTNIALAVLTCGVYLAVFGLCHLAELEAGQALGNRSFKAIDRVSDIKQRQAQHLVYLETLASQGQWQHLATHTAHPHSGFDWWMFPIDRPSNGYGDRYAVTSADVSALQADSEFMESYRRGVDLVVQSWGWDLATETDITDDVQKWRGWSVRLGKMAQSLKLFGEDDLHARLRRFVVAKLDQSKLDRWVLRALDLT